MSSPRRPLKPSNPQNVIFPYGWYEWIEKEDEFFEALAKQLREQIEKVQANIKFCENWLAKIKKECAERKLDESTHKRIHDLATDFDLWRLMRDLAIERRDELKQILGALEGVKSE